MAYLTPIHCPSSIRHAVKLRFLSAEEECLIVAKANRLEIYTQSAEGLTLKHGAAVYGKISMLQKLHLASSKLDHLFVGTDRYTYFTLRWDESTKQLRTEQSYVDQADKTGRDSQTTDRCQVDPTGRFLSLELFEGILTVIPARTRVKGVIIDRLGDPIPVRIPELFVRSSAYLHPRNPEVQREKPRMALLYTDTQEKVGLKIRVLDFSTGMRAEPGSADFDEEFHYEEDLDLGASHLIPVPAPAYGLLVLAETSITYLDDMSYRTIVEPLKEATIFVAWEQIDAQRWLLADDYGQLYLIMLLVEGQNVSGWKLDRLGTTSRASVLVYLDAGFIFVGSHQGDSQVVKIEEKSLEVVQTISNIAPILDFTVVDMGNRAGDGQINEYSSGQARIVAGSGAFQDGSLRSIRSGVALEELGIIGEMTHITDLFTLGSKGNRSRADTLCVSFLDETRVFGFTLDGDVEETDEFKSFEMKEATILAANVSPDRILQVTPSSVRLCDLESGMMIANWTSPPSTAIIAASTNSRHLLLSVGGTEAVVLDMMADLNVSARKTYSSESQIACIEVSELLPDICFIGFWQSAALSVLKTETLQDVHNIRVSDDDIIIPRSVLLAQILPEHPPTLFIALADGNVVTYDVDASNYSLRARKSTALGTQQATLRAIPRVNGLFNVFAMCEHPSLIYGSEGRMIYSAVTADGATCICPFDSEHFPDAIAIATKEDLKIALVDTGRTTHVQTLHVGETVRRLAHSTILKAFVLGTIKRTLKDGVEVVQSHLKLVDEVVFEELDTFTFREDELVECLIRADIYDQEETAGQPRMPVERFIVGTSWLENPKSEPIRGRILIFDVTDDRKLKLKGKASLMGACRVLGVLNGIIIAALVKTVVAFSLNMGALSRICSYKTSTAPMDIAIVGDCIAISDVMKSVSIVQYKRGTNGEPDTLIEVGRHFQTAWSTAVAPVDDDTYLESDAEGNLMVLHQNVHGVTEDDRRRLGVTSEIRLGEMVNRIRRINVPTSAKAVVVPRAFMATVDGSIFLFALIHQDKQDFLMRLQGNLAQHTSGLGNMPFNKYRAFKNEIRQADEPYRFVDGELIERFLDCSPSVQEEVVRGLGVGIEEVKTMVEGLRRLR